MTDIVKLYDPQQSAGLTPEQILNLQSLTVQQIKELAKAYPNSANTRAYLLIIDSKKPIEKQLPQLSSWENLYNLITRNGLKTFVAFGFRGSVKPRSLSPARVRRSEVLDLSDQELLTLPGFRTKDKEHPEMQVKVTKIKTKQAEVNVQSSNNTLVVNTNPL